MLFTTSASRRWPTARGMLDGLRRRAPELLAFGGIGALAYVVDTGAFNVLRATVFDSQVLTAKVVATTIAIAVAWLGNRYLTFRRRGTHPLWREALLFVASNLVGLGIALGCLFVSHYLLGFRSTLADNISGNVVGVALGTLFRYVAYRHLVFRAPPALTRPPLTARPEESLP